MAGALPDHDMLRDVLGAGSAACWVGSWALRKLGYVNRAFEEIWSRGRCDLEADPCSWLADLAPEHRERAQALVEGVMGKVDFTWRLEPAAGPTRWVKGQLLPLPSRESAGAWLALVAHDITEEKLAGEELEKEAAERKQAEKAVREREELLRSLIDNTTAVIYIKHVDGRYRLINKRFEELFNIGREEVRGKTDHDMFPREMADAFRANDLRVLETRKPLEWEEYAPHPDGIHTYISIKFPLLDSSGTPYLICGISTDITERKRAEEHAQRLHAELAHLSRLSTMGEAASSLAHELNQPLTAITTYTTACANILRSGDSSSPKLLHMLEQASAQAEHAGAVVRRLRTFVSRREHHLSSVDINELVREAAHLEELEVRRVQAKLELDLEEGLPLLQLDRVQIVQVVLNLLRNALEAMAGEPLDHRQARIRTRREAGLAVRVEIIDRGCGISPAIESSLFEPFQTTKPGGMGMGLTISRSIVEAHGGKLWAEPGGERGAVFAFRLPL